MPIKKTPALIHEPKIHSIQQPKQTSSVIIRNTSSYPLNGALKLSSALSSPVVKSLKFQNIAPVVPSPPLSIPAQVEKNLAVGPLTSSSINLSGQVSTDSAVEEPSQLTEPRATFNKEG